MLDFQSFFLDSKHLFKTRSTNFSRIIFIPKEDFISILKDFPDQHVFLLLF